MELNTVILNVPFCVKYFAAVSVVVDKKLKTWIQNTWVGVPIPTPTSCVSQKKSPILIFLSRFSHL